MSAVPRIVVSAPSSGHGKTAVSVGLLAALSARGLRPAAFKIGPDFVDAAYLGLAAGRRGRNLDPRLVGSHRVAPLFVHGAGGADIAVVEGTMGLYDGLTSRTDSESTAQVAGLLRAPVVLVVDVASMGQSAAALVHGFRTYDELLWLGGVVLTRTISGRHEHLLRESLADIGVPVLGALRRRDLAALGSGGGALPPRDQGLAPAAQRSLEALRGIRRLGELVASAVDLDRLLVLARSAPRLGVDPWSAAAAVAVDDPTAERFAPYGAGHRPVIAVASAYGYAETPELLAAAGAEVIEVDPLRDERLPDRVDALVVPGGLPEAYADQLSANTRLRGDVLALARTGRPVIAEGAGMVWLGRELDGLPMCGVLDTSARTGDRYVVGYREATVASRSVVHGRGDTVTGHKLHRTSVTPRAGATPAWSWAGGPPEGFVEGAVHASYLSVHWAGVPSMAPRLVAAAGALSAAYAPGSTPIPAPPSWQVHKWPAASVTPALPPPYVADGDDLPPLEPWAPEIPPRAEPARSASGAPAMGTGAPAMGTGGPALGTAMVPGPKPVLYGAPVTPAATGLTGAVGIAGMAGAGNGAGAGSGAGGSGPVSGGPVSGGPVSGGPVSAGSTPPEPVMLASVPTTRPGATGWPELPTQLGTGPAQASAPPAGAAPVSAAPAEPAGPEATAAPAEPAGPPDAGGSIVDDATTVVTADERTVVVAPPPADGSD